MSDLNGNNNPIALDKTIKLVLSVKVWVPRAQHAEFFEHFKPAYDHVLAEEECRFFVVTTDLDDADPDRLSWVEGWSEDVEWLQTVQLKKPYYEPYVAATRPMFTKPMAFEVLSPMQGMVHFKAP